VSWIRFASEVELEVELELELAADVGSGCLDESARSPHIALSAKMFPALEK
jgi:hypothetical protein